MRTEPLSSPTGPTSRRIDWVPLIIDVVLVIVFATIGRRNHEHGLTIGGIAATAGPFLLGAAAGWGLQQYRRIDSWTLRAGVISTLATVIIGMLVRVATGGGTAVSFIIVATCVLTAFLVGWRLVAGRLRRPA